MREFMSEAFALALLTVLLYVYAYFFEVGYAARFLYPPELIGPTLSSFVGVWVLMLFVLLFGFLQLNLQYWPHQNRWKVGFIAALIVYVFAVLTAMAFSRTSWATTAVAFSSSAIAIAANAAYTRSVQKQRSAIEENDATSTTTLHAAPDIRDTFTVYDRKSNIPQYSIAYALVKYFGRDPLSYFLLFLIVAPSMCLYAGFTQAYAAKGFYLLEGKDDFVAPELVIRIVNGIIVSVPFDPETKTYRRQFRVQQVSDIGDQRLSPLQIETLTELKKF